MTGSNDADDFISTVSDEVKAAIAKRRVGTARRRAADALTPQMMWAFDATVGRDQPIAGVLATPSGDAYVVLRPDGLTCVAWPETGWYGTFPSIDAVLDHHDDSTVMWENGSTHSAKASGASTFIIGPLEFTFYPATGTLFVLRWTDGGTYEVKVTEPVLTELPSGGWVVTLDAETGSKAAFRRREEAAIFTYKLKAAMETWKAAVADANASPKVEAP